MPTAPADPPPAPILILAAHPELRHSRVSRRLMEVVRGRPDVAVRDLYAHYPDFVIDVAAEQAAAAAARLIVWLHPIHWYGMPALMKLWVDEVLTLGWAYGRGGTALHGKDLWLVVSTGGTEAAYQPDGYNRRRFDAFLPPYAQTAALCGLRFLPPLVLHGAHEIDDAVIEAHARRFVRLIDRHPDWHGLAPERRAPVAPAAEVPPRHRPVEED